MSSTAVFVICFFDLCTFRSTGLFCIFGHLNRQRCSRKHGHLAIVLSSAAQPVIDSEENNGVCTLL